MKNEPAFPQKEPLTSDAHGLTIRDYFAAKAMQALVSRDSRNVYDDEKVSSRSYKIADSMLAERERD